MRGEGGEGVSGGITVWHGVTARGFRWITVNTPPRFGEGVGRGATSPGRLRLLRLVAVWRSAGHMASFDSREVIASYSGSDCLTLKNA